MAAGALMFLLVTAGAALLGFAGTGLVIGGARRGAWLDQPGPDRMHATPVPRGGGIGFVLAWLMLGLLPAFAVPQVEEGQWSAAWQAAGLALVAVVGWADDHSGLPVWPRLLAHSLAGICVAIAWHQGTAALAQPAWFAVTVVLIALGTVASINLHNFFDGADGLLASHALVVMTVLAFLAWHVDHAALAISCVALAAGIAGFLPRNLAPARVFMGDVGSGVIGFAIAASCVMAVRDDVLTLPQALILGSGVLLDTVPTLLARVLRSEKFWMRHREHLYQRLLRSGWSHGRAAAAWLCWNLLIAVPALVIARRWTAAEWLVTAIVYAFGMSLWIFLQHRLHPLVEADA